MIDYKEIVKFLKRKFTKIDLVLLVGLISLYFATRLINLEILPIFGDEGIYIRWAKTAWHDASWRFISLTDGKQPLQTWATIPFLKLFPTNALLAGRLFSVATGFTSLVGIFVLLYYLFDKKTGYWGSFLYIITPYFLFYDRMALADSGVNAAFVWILLFSILLINLRRLDIALLFGLLAGTSLLIKSSVRLFLALSIFAPILIWSKNLRKNFNLLINFFILFIIVGLLSLIIYNVQRLSPFFHYVAEKNKTFVMTVSEWRQQPFQYFFHNLKLIPEFIFAETGWLLPLFSFPGMVLLLRNKRRLAIYLLLWLILPYLILSFFSKIIFPRYLIFFGTLLLIFASYFLVQLKTQLVRLIFIALIIAMSIYYGYAILINPINLPFPPVDRGQYIEGVTAGWGVKEIVDYAREKSFEKPVIILAEGGFGVVGDQLEVFINQGDNIVVKGYWPLEEKSLLENQFELENKSVFVVFSHRQDIPINWPLKLIKKYPKPKSNLPLSLFALTK